MTIINGIKSILNKNNLTQTYRRACLKAISDTYSGDKELMMERMEDESYAALFKSGDDLILARIPDRFAKVFRVYLDRGILEKEPA